MFSEKIEIIAKGILSQYESIFTNSTNNWDIREDKVINLCNKIFPNKYWFTNWEVFDSDGNTAGQIDIIIYDKLQSFVFSDWEKILAPIESTYWIIEVKSNLTTAKLDEAILKLNAFQNLKKEPINKNVVRFSPYNFFSWWMGINIDAKYSNMWINVIFAFDTNISEETIYKKVIESSCIDILIIPWKYFIIWRRHEKFILEWNSQKIDFISVIWEPSVSVWMLYLQVLLSTKDLKL